MAVASNDVFGPSAITKPSGAIDLPVGANYQQIIDDAGPGATFWFAGGVHNLTTPIVPLAGQTFLGAPGAVLDGSRTLTSFTEQNGLYVAGGQTQEGMRNDTAVTAPGAARGGYPETFFLDGKPLTPVASTADVKSGTFYLDYDTKQVYLGDNPAGHTVQAGIASAAFASTAANVTISNLTIQHFDSPVQQGAIQGGQNWTVENNEVASNFGVGIKVQDGSTIKDNYVHDNGEMGLGGSGANITVDHNDIASNGGWAGIDPNWEGGGEKFSQTSNLLVENNYSHDNHGPGLWTDIDNINTTYSGNLVVDNDGAGITHEISYAAKITGNTVEGNGATLKGEGSPWGAQIQIQNSQNVEVSDNKVDMSGGLNGIMLIQQDRGSGAYGEHTTTNNSVHDNTIVNSSGSGMTGGFADYDKQGLLDGSNSFANNTYNASGTTDNWRWGDETVGDTFAQYQKDSGQDQGSTISPILPNTATWLSDWNGGAGAPTDPGTAASTPVVTTTPTSGTSTPLASDPQPVLQDPPATSTGTTTTTAPDAASGGGTPPLIDPNQGSTSSGTETAGSGDQTSDGGATDPSDGTGATGGAIHHHGHHGHHWAVHVAAQG
ncbi:right-handed parallel beta-helix repeat-containing protein [Lichenihabitans psoromatis]|uniref:right-handed parallel beta-helix repeat-containing protein n=1 Tax=Lichenihabitans psoromatis TaxID=2528642 RepID=UPI001036072F|nr:right-handed parallel beta-helix repeat-containing protein [Lichenihabitans psoromatis]